MESNRWKQWLVAGATGLAIGAGAQTGPSSGQQDKSDQGRSAQQGQGQKQQAGTKQPQGAQEAKGAAFVILPLAVVVDTNFNKGCWARFYSDQDFKGEVLALSGPIQLTSMDRAQPFWGEADSAIVGPKARVTTYDNENLRDQTAALKPDQRIRNLRERMGWFEGIESVRLECTK